MSDNEKCLFCKIVHGEIPAEIIYQDQDVLVFSDINPQAPVHILVIPKKHISTLNDIEEEDLALVGKMIKTAADMAKKYNIAEPGYRTVFNCNAGAGQTVFHIHLHLLGGRAMNWPPG